MNNKIIMIDALSCSGKSTTAQLISHHLNLSGFPTEWYHEEEDNHPLEYPWKNNEATHSIYEVRQFMKIYPSMFKDFIQKIKSDNKIHIIESYYLQDSIRYLFQNNIDKNEIFDFHNEINEVIKPLNPLIVYFHHDDVVKSLNNIWKIRGEEWKKWFIDNVGNASTYVKNKKLNGEHGIFTLLNDYQNFTKQLLDTTTFPIITLNSTDK